MLYDVPHIFKNIRNNLLTYNFVIDGKVVSFKYIRQMFDEDQKSNLRLATKLTKYHFELLPFKKMNVRLATQLLSHSTAAAMRTYVHFGRIDVQALDTADFDILNSMTAKAERKWKKPLRLREVEHFDFLRDSIDWIGRWTFINLASGKEKKLPFHSGLQQTVNGVLLATWDLLTKFEFSYVLTARFNQDAIENFFACIRAKGRNNDTRTCTEYEQSVKHLAVNWLLQHPEGKTNCEDDADTFLTVMEHMKSIRRNADDTDGSIPATGLPSDLHNVADVTVVAASQIACHEPSTITDWPDLFELSEVDSNVVAYICGYLCMKVNARTDCSKCQSLYDNYRQHRSYLEETEFGSHEVYGHFRNFNWAKHGLQKPSFSLYSLCSSVEKIVQMNIEAVVSGRYSVAAKLLDIVLQAVDLQTFELESVCSAHQKQQLIYVTNLYLRLRIFHFVKIRNRELKDMEILRKNKAVTKKNRKLDKISHR